MSSEDIHLQGFLGRFNVGLIFAIGSDSSIRYATNKPNNGLPETQYAIKRTRRIMEDVTNAPQIEVDIMRSINHENLVSIVDSHISKKYIYIVMDFITGRHLFYYIEWNIKFERSEIAKVIHDLASALSYIHGYNIIHRDINPRNVMIEIYDNYKIKYVKLIDFGSATYSSEPLCLGVIQRTELQDLKSKTSNKNVDEKCKVFDYGCPNCLDKPWLYQRSVQFYAPELLHGYKYGCKVDVWSLGILLCYMVFGLEISCFDFTHKVLNFNFSKCCIPVWFNKSPLLKKLLKGMLDKNEKTRLSSEKVLHDQWITIHTLNHTEK